MEPLIDKLQASGALRTKVLVEAFKTVDRADFVPFEQSSYAYVDQALPIRHNQTISQPSTVAFMLETLQPEPGDTVLDVGAGSGWTTALLAYIVGARGHVYGLEVVPELVKFGQDNLRQYEYKHAEILQAGEELGLPASAPFDKILVSASAPETPQPLIDQLAVGGRMVASVRSSLVRVDKTDEDGVDIEEYPGFVFVPLQWQ